MDNIKVKIEDSVQSILNNKFTDRSRKRIKKFGDRLNFCCPICGDSINDITKKRGNIYFSNLRYICFNCGYTSTVDKFLKSFDISLTIDELETIHNISNSKQTIKTVNDDFWLFKLLEAFAVPIQVLKNRIGLVDCNNLDYLKNRYIPKDKYKHFLYRPSTNEIYVLNLSDSNKVIGFQVRQLNENTNKPKYMSYNISKIYNKFLLIDKTFNDFIREKISIDNIDNVVEKLNTISLLFNILNVSLCDDLKVVEGPIDSIFLNNCVALCGASRLSNYFDELENVYFIFDNDETGREHAFEKLRSGKYVFLWNKINLERVKDVNDVVKSGFNADDIFSVDNFSNLELDSIYI